MSSKPRAPLNLAFPGKGAASPKPDVVAGEVREAVTTPVPQLRHHNLPLKAKNEYAALTIRPGPERRRRLEEISRSSGHSMQDILLHCFDMVFPPG